MERESGAIIASDGPLSDPCTVYIWDVSVDANLCYDWYIYDSYGDGIHSYGCGYYRVYGFDGELMCYGGYFAYIDFCLDMSDCLPHACCLGSNCTDLGREECDELGRRWFLGEECAEFECPPDPCSDAIWQNGFPPAHQCYVYPSQCDPGEPMQVALADDFVLSGEGLIEIIDLTVWFSHWNADPVATPADYDGVTVTIYNDAGGQPAGYPIDGNPYCNVAGSFVFHQHYEPGQFDYLEEAGNVWRLTFEISDLTLAPGTTYWLSVQPVLQRDPLGLCGNTPTNQQIGSQPLLNPPYTSEWHFTGGLVPGLSFCINGIPLSTCDYTPGDCDHDGNPLELEDVMFMIGMYRGSVIPPYDCICPPHGDNFAPTADPNGNCTPNELNDVVTEIGAYRGTAAVSGCPDCPGEGRLIIGHKKGGQKQLGGVEAGRD